MNVCPCPLKLYNSKHMDMNSTRGNHIQYLVYLSNGLETIIIIHSILYVGILRGGAYFQYFRGWLGSHEIFPPTKINAYGDMRVHDDGRGQKISWKCGQHFPVLASKGSHYHPADGIFNTYILLSHAIYPSLSQQRRSQARSSACINYIIACAVPRPWTGCCHKFKTTKINSEGLLWLSTKINTPKNYPPYSM